MVDAYTKRAAGGFAVVLATLAAAGAALTLVAAPAKTQGAAAGGIADIKLRNANGGYTLIEPGKDGYAVWAEQMDWLMGDATRSAAARRAVERNLFNVIHAAASAIDPDGLRRPGTLSVKLLTPVVG